MNPDRAIGCIERALGSGDGKAAIKRMHYLTSRWQRCSSSTDIKRCSGELVHVLRLLGRHNAAAEQAVCMHLIENPCPRVFHDVSDVVAAAEAVVRCGDSLYPLLAQHSSSSSDGEGSSSGSGIESKGCSSSMRHNSRCNSGSCGSVGASTPSCAKEAAVPDLQPQRSRLKAMALLLMAMCTFGVDADQAQRLTAAMLSVPGIGRAIMQVGLDATAADLERGVVGRPPHAFEIFTSSAVSLIHRSSQPSLPPAVGAALSSLDAQLEQNADLVVDVICGRMGNGAGSGSAETGIELLSTALHGNSSSISSALSRRADEVLSLSAVYLKQGLCRAPDDNLYYRLIVLKAVQGILFDKDTTTCPPCLIKAAVDAGLLPLLLSIMGRPNQDGMCPAPIAARILRLMAVNELDPPSCGRMQHSSSIAHVPGAAAAVVAALRAAATALESDASEASCWAMLLLSDVADLIRCIIRVEVRDGRLEAEAGSLGRGSGRTAGAGWSDVLVPFGLVPLLLRALGCCERGSNEHAGVAATVGVLAYAQLAQLPALPLQQHQEYEQQQQQQQQQPEQRGPAGSMDPDEADRLKQRAWEELAAAGGASITYMRLLVGFDARCKADLIEAPGALAGVAAAVVAAVADGNREQARLSTRLLEGLAEWAVDSKSVVESDEGGSQEEGEEGAHVGEGDEARAAGLSSTGSSNSSSGGCSSDGSIGDWDEDEQGEDESDGSCSDSQVDYIGRSISALKQLQEHNGSCLAVAGEVRAALRVLGSEEDGEAQGGKEQPPLQQQQQQQEEEHHQQQHQSQQPQQQRQQSGPAPVPATLRSCAGCGKAAGADGVRLHTCRGCCMYAFCSQECYRQAWVSGGHREVCKAEQERRSQRVTQ